MLLRLSALFAIMLWLNACATLEDSGRAYFRQGNKVKGVEPVDALLERMKTDRELRDIAYGQIKAARIVQCTLLRNQLYVAALNRSSSKEILDAARLMEMAYQDNDQAFLTACDQIVSTELGKTFMTIQQEYLMRKDS